jgi:hypothetical protein
MGRVTAYVGRPFLVIGVLFLIGTGLVFVWGYQKARKMITVLREGTAAPGQIIDIHPNYSIRVNGRNPWVIRYQFMANGENLEGKVTTFNPSAGQIQVGNAVYVLYTPQAPKWNTIYPHL